MSKKFLNIGTSLLIIAAFAVTVISCKKEPILNGSEQIQRKTLSSNMRTFASIDELFGEIDKVISMDEQQLQEYENEIGFYSFGRKAESIYFPIVEGDEDGIEVDEAQNYVSQHPAYLELKTDDAGDYEFLPRFDGNTFRYIMNEDRMFQLEEIVYRVFNDAVIGLPIENANELFDITEENIAQKIDEPVYTVLCNNVKSHKGNYGYSITLYSPVASNNKERVKGEFESLHVIHPYIMYNSGRMLIRGEWRASKRTVWTICKRTLNTNLSMSITRNGNTRSGSDQYKSSSPEYKHERTIISTQSASLIPPHTLHYGYISSLTGQAWIATTTLNLNYN